jgi:hypothetical protein
MPAGMNEVLLIVQLFNLLQLCHNFKKSPFFDVIQLKQLIFGILAQGSVPNIL